MGGKMDDASDTMNAPHESPQQRSVKSKKAAGPAAPPANSDPVAFFLRPEKEMDSSGQQQRGRKQSREMEGRQQGGVVSAAMGSMFSDDSYGVQSLEDTMNPPSALAYDHPLARTDSNLSEASVGVGADASVMPTRKRKAGNPVHPRIAATGQRIISAEQHAPHAATSASPSSIRSTADSPRRSHIRRSSTSSSFNLTSRPLTPLRMSPRPASAMPSTPRSGSPKSFRLSDEEISVASDTHSQAVQSSNEEDEDSGGGVGSTQFDGLPQLVMPSIAMPARRPFTERGKRIGRLKIMIVGAKGTGKTSLIQNICRTCEDIVHVDEITPRSSEAVFDPRSGNHMGDIREVGASSRPYPAWWTDFDNRRMLLKRKSLGEGVLERNLTFIDTPGLDEATSCWQVQKYFDNSLSRAVSLEKMNDSELISMLSGEGGVQVDAVIYLFDPYANVDDVEASPALDESQAELLRLLCKWTNVTPVISRADRVEPSELVARKKQIVDLFQSLGVLPYSNLQSEGSQTQTEPFAVSSALADDSETIDASVLMASGYVQPLEPSELTTFVTSLLNPDNTARLRHLSATKFLLWRQEHLGTHLDLQKQLLLKSPRFPAPSSPGITTDNLSITDEPSKVLVPHGSSSYYLRSSSPTISDSSLGNNHNNAVAPSSYSHTHTHTSDHPSLFRQVRLAKWASDLQRSLDNERKRYQRLYTSGSAQDWLVGPSSNDGTSNHGVDTEKSTLPLTTTHSRPPRGRLGGDLAIIDPRDPLGILAFAHACRRRSRLALGCGIVGAVCWWVLRNWTEAQEVLSSIVGGSREGGGGVVRSVGAVPAPVVPVAGRDLVGWGSWALGG